jgi:hypothetical protein
MISSADSFMECRWLLTSAALFLFVLRVSPSVYVVPRHSQIRLGHLLTTFLIDNKTQLGVSDICSATNSFERKNRLAPALCVKLRSAGLQMWGYDSRPYELISLKDGLHELQSELIRQRQLRFGSIKRDDDLRAKLLPQRD